MATAVTKRATRTFSFASGLSAQCIRPPAGVRWKELLGAEKLRKHDKRSRHSGRRNHCKG